jgi:hypothetical protein
LAPSSPWGGGGGLTLKPTVKLGVQLYTDDENTVYKGKESGGSYTYTDIAGESKNGKNTSFIRPKIEAGASVGGLPWGLGASLDYAVNFDIYTSSYDLYGGSDNVAGTVSWGGADNYSFYNKQPNETTAITKGKVNIEEKTLVWQRITPALTWGTALGDNVALKLRFNLPFTIRGETSGGRYSKSWETETRTTAAGDTTVIKKEGTAYQSGESDVSTFGVAPSLALGTQIAAIPDKLTVNLGLNAGVSYSGTTTRTKPKADGWTTTKETVNGVETKNERTSDIASGSQKLTDTYTVDESFGDLSTAITAGFTLKFNPSFLLDTSYTSSAASAASGTTPVFDFQNGKFTLMFTIKK